jgi:hypothetical protein
MTAHETSVEREAIDEVLSAIAPPLNAISTFSHRNSIKKRPIPFDGRNGAIIRVSSRHVSGALQVQYHAHIKGSFLLFDTSIIFVEITIAAIIFIYLLRRVVVVDVRVASCQADPTSVCVWVSSLWVGKNNSLPGSTAIFLSLLRTSQRQSTASYPDSPVPMKSSTTTNKRSSIRLSGAVESLIVSIMFCILSRANAFVRPSSSVLSVSPATFSVVGGKADTILSFNGQSSRGIVSGKGSLRAVRKSRLYVASSTKLSSDQSAMSKSRAPFRMPRNSADDSKVVGRTTSGKPNSKNGNDLSSVSSPTLSWNRMGLLTELCTALQGELKLPSPTPVQSLVIPELLRPERESMAFLAATGSGKTLAYVLPLIQQLKQQEMFENYERRPKRPRMLILAPTRELAVQITHVVKSLSHSVKLSTQALVGGQDKGTQRKAMEERPVDVVVATPGRLIQQWKDGNLFLGSVETVVLDEMDTMLEQVRKNNIYVVI